jgi:hypothetical protein
MSLVKKKAANKKPIARASPVTTVTFGELASVVGAPLDDSRFVDIVTRLGRKLPTRAASHLDAKPHGVSFDFGTAGENSITDLPPQTRVVQEVYVHITRDPGAGTWVGDLPEWVTRSSTPDDVQRGARTDTPSCGEFSPAETSIVVAGADGTNVILVFLAAKLEHINIVIDRL